MKRLIIDDLRDLPLGDATTVRTAQEAFLLIDEDWDEIWLDYDLGGKAYETDDAKTIMPFVDLLVERALFQPTKKRPQIFVHTMNPAGRQRIKSALNKYYELTDVMLV